MFDVSNTNLCIVRIEAFGRLNLLVLLAISQGYHDSTKLYKGYRVPEVTQIVSETYVLIV